MRDRALSGSAYLLGTLATAVATVLALPVLFVPTAARRWADLHRRRAGRLLGVPPDGRRVGRRVPAWALAHVAVGFPFGLAALLCLGNVLVAAVALPLWWALPVLARLHARLCLAVLAPSARERLTEK
ncbi:hypothetical protein BJF79_20580 [Actinomadura sp. CNU-125]|uniref:hypothetical protein n=1 Tax=Actinomadura sp. CNU-125 TaxID=1904961 RepID=UPI00096852AB|nr:hypothetical protein [Actinomadura sp. CNU-125]OLT13447.1 hypothetical protein BJF79_20580 [Actinomadura sp. CNU-125]